MSLTFVVPDLHGRFDLLRAALEMLSTHHAGSIVLLGDYVDKGPQSKQVVDRLVIGLDRLSLGLPDAAANWRVVALKGNHDAMMVAALRDPSRMPGWIGKGGDQALQSYGGDPAAVPQAHVDWLDQRPLMHLDRHRVYVHAGVDPDLPLSQQAEQTLLNKRYPPGEAFGFGDLHVVHGHDNFPDGPLLYAGRSNLDTQAWRTGRLVIGVFEDDKAGGPVDLLEIKGSAAAR